MGVSSCMVLSVTTPAVQKICGLMAAEEDCLLRLRVYITGGGCQGFQYGFAFELEKEHDDVEVFIAGPDGKNNVKSIFLFLHMLVLLYWDVQGAQELRPQRLLSFISLLIDPISLQYLRGSEVDYVLDGHGERFVVKNPNATTTCGCDRSFATA